MESCEILILSSSPDFAGFIETPIASGLSKLGVFKKTENNIDNNRAIVKKSKEQRLEFGAF